MTRFKNVPAGLVDAGTSSLATFAAGVAATQLLGGPALGVYAIFFSAWLLASKLPTQLILVPAEARLVRIPSSERTAYLLRNSVMGLPPALVGSAAVFAVLLIVPRDVDAVTAIQLSATAALEATLFPLQEHARGLFHLSRFHWFAASASIVRLVVVTLVLITGWKAGVSPSLLPFGSLAAGDACALAFSFLVVRPKWKAKPPYTELGLLRSGKWLLLSASMEPASAFVVSLLVINLASAAALGLAEAARIAAQPVFVFALGLSIVIRPASMEAAIRGARVDAQRLSKRLTWGLVLVTLLYLAVVSLPEPINPLQELIPTAFVVSGLVQLSVVAAFFGGVVILQRAELVALDRTRSLSIAEAAPSGGHIAVGMTSTLLRFWAVPLGSLFGGVIRWWSYSRILARAYRNMSTARHEGTRLGPDPEES